jgi:hypothetical protein
MKVHLSLEVSGEEAEYYQNHLREEWEKRKNYGGFWSKVTELSFGESYGNISTGERTKPQPDLF